MRGFATSMTLKVTIRGGQLGNFGSLFVVCFIWSLAPLAINWVMGINPQRLKAPNNEFVNNGTMRGFATSMTLKVTIRGGQLGNFGSLFVVCYIWSLAPSAINWVSILSNKKPLIIPSLS